MYWVHKSVISPRAKEARDIFSIFVNFHFFSAAADAAAALHHGKKYDTLRPYIYILCASEEKKNVPTQKGS